MSVHLIPHTHSVNEQFCKRSYTLYSVYFYMYYASRKKEEHEVSNVGGETLNTISLRPTNYAVALEAPNKPFIHMQ